MNLRRKIFTLLGVACATWSIFAVVRLTANCVYSPEIFCPGTPGEDYGMGWRDLSMNLILFALVAPTLVMAVAWFSLRPDR